MATLIANNHRNRVEKILRIFDQKNIFQREHFADSDKIENPDEELEYMINRLVKAAADKDLAHKMDVEDEMYGELDNRAKEIEILRIKADGLAKENDCLAKEKDSIAKENQKLIQEKIASAKAMKSYGMPIELIANSTGLSIKDIELL